ncbi:MAG: hypothetical protein ACQEP7_06475, partial [bacterium]
QLVERLCEKLGNSPDKKAKQQFVKNIRRQIKGWSPSLVNWREDHFEENNLLETENQKYIELARSLEEKLLNRFEDPLDISDQETDELEEEEEEELKESLEDLGYL